MTRGHGLQAVHSATVRGDDDPWLCEQNFERPGASCAEPGDDEVSVPAAGPASFPWQ